MSANGKSEELTPKQIEFLKNYNDPKSETFSNALQSALKAGYSQEYAETIMSKDLDWMSESVGRRKRMLAKAEARLESAIDSDNESEANKVSMFIAKTIGKNEGYSDRTEHTGPNGGAIEIIENITDEQAERIFQRRITGLPSSS